MEEIWKDVVGYEGIYQVSNLGRVKRDFVLKNILDRKGYYYVNLSIHGKVKSYRVHQLVAKAFIPNPKGYIEVNHIDGTKTNNHIDNLEWCSREENMQHAFKHGLKTKKGIEKSVNAMLNKTRKPILQLKNGIVVNRFISISEAIRQTKINHIYSSLKESKLVKGYLFVYDNKMF